MLYYCLHALHESPGNFTKCQVRLPHWSQTHTRISLSIQEATLDLSLTTISSCLLGVIIQHFYTPALPSEAFQPTRKRKTTPGPSHLHTDWGKYICTKPNTLLLKTPWMVTESTAPCRSAVQMKHKQMAFLQHLHLHKAAAVIPCPVNTSHCTFPPAKSSGQIRGGLLKIADGSKTTTELTPGCASTSLTAGWRPWRIILESTAQLGGTKAQSPLWWQGQAPWREVKVTDNFKQKSCPPTFSAVHSWLPRWPAGKETVATKRFPVCGTLSGLSPVWDDSL